MPAPSLPSAGARRAQTRTDSTRAAATKPAEGLFDGGSSRKKAAETPAPVYADLPVDEAARYRKMRDIAVKEWGASPRIVDAAIAEALRQGVDPSLVLSVIWQESRFHSKATSPVGARGLMQVMPETGKGLGVKDPDMLYDVKTNLRAGIKYLKIAGKKFGIDDISNVMDDSFAKVKALLASYNAGMGAVSRWLKTQGGELVRIPYKETRQYVAAIGAKLESLWEALG
jgi:soluble lytic murein transglycosylase